MSRYLDVARFRQLTIMPGGDVDLLEVSEQGWLQRRIDRIGAHIDARLIKRYGVPFGEEPVPPAVLRVNTPLIIEDWIVSIVTLEAYTKRGFNPSSAMDEAAILAPATKAKEEIEEAANSESGLYELPMKSTVSAGGVSKGGPLGYSETSPYVGFDLQGDAARIEDFNRDGSS